MGLAGKSKHDVVSEFRCGEILAAARKVFAVSGFNETTMDEIAAAAGIAKGTVYLYFSSKKEIYLAALKQGLTELMDRTRTNMRSANGIQARLRAFVRTRIEYAEANHAISLRSTIPNSATTPTRPPMTASSSSSISSRRRNSKKFCGAPWIAAKYAMCEAILPLSSSTIWCAES